MEVGVNDLQTFFPISILEVTQLSLEYISGKIQAALLRDEHSDQS